MRKAILGVDPNEEIILDIHRHPVGIVGFFLFGGMTILVLLITLFLVLSTGGFSTQTTAFITLASVAVGLFVVLITSIAIFIYRANELIITNENIVQILRQSLIDKKVSQLNLSKVQDVSVDQEGFIPTIFNYGTIRIETAGEATNYVFTHVANPPAVAKQIVEAHERYIALNGASSRDGL